MSNRPVATILADAASAAMRAPSVHNTQPWHFVASPQALELFAERNRRLSAIDPQGRLLILSCGAVLQHVQAVLAARGWTSQVDRFPDPQQPDLLARITLGEQIEVTAAAMRILHAIGTRFTDRRPVRDTTLTAGTLDVIQAAAAQAGAGVHVLTAEQISALARASMKANELGVANPDQRDELYYWVGGLRTDGAGVPDSALPEHRSKAEVPGRDFTRIGTLQTGDSRAHTATHVILHRGGDEPIDWLLAGEATSACWLKATDLGLAVLPLSSVIEIGVTREALRQLLPGAAYPMLVLRFGMPNLELALPPLTPRLTAEEIVSTSPGEQ